MKSASPPLMLGRRPRIKAERSQALVLVLCSLVFITAVVLAFLGSVTTEIQSSKFYANGASVKLLADSTVSLVMGQIKDATHGLDANNNLLAWASQPGMIRTYDTTGAASGYYKLYSWDGMVGTGAFNPSSSAEVPPANWSANPAVYTDLNDPVYNTALGSFIYPIVDPAATNTVQGFSITGAPVTSRDAAPMPVKWLYVLQNGAVAPAEEAGATTATVAGATTSNPIVGRIAFWTDDDTCKININTAAGDVWVNENNPPALSSGGGTSTGNPGSFWDTPRTESLFDRSLAIYQPAQNEFQRYPGHPATTYLSAVFTNLTPAQIDSIVPRVNGGGSAGGTVPFTSATAITPDSDRLYGSVDELLFSTNMASGVRTANTPVITNSALEQAQFFLTAHSRAPDVNLFNLPRVVTWPENSIADATHRTAFDNLIAFCGTLNNSPTANTDPNIYYFQRSSSTSQTADLPTSGATTGLGRNRELITYLRNLTSLAIPGFGSSTFLAKYPSDRDQILTEIFDYIRTLNLSDTSVSPFNPFTPTSSNTGSGQVLPIVDQAPSSGTIDPRGMGRFPTITEAAFIFIGAGQTIGPAATQTSVVTGELPIANGYTRVRAAFVFKFFNPSNGYIQDYNNFQVKVTGLGSFAWGGVPMGFSDATAKMIGGDSGLRTLLGNLSYPYPSVMSRK